MRTPIFQFARRFTLAALLAVVTTLDATAATPVPPRPSASGAGNSYLPRFSSDGNFVAFLSHANNLATNDDAGQSLDLFVRYVGSVPPQWAPSNALLASVSSNGFGGADRDVGTFALSHGARFAAFESAAGNLVPGDTNFVSDIYVRDLALGITRLVSVGADGAGPGNGPSFNPLISIDGRHVIFESHASNLVTNDFNGTNDVFFHDLITSTTTLVSVNADGTASPGGPSYAPSISTNGLIVAFISQATNLVAGVTNQAGEIYLRDVAAGTNGWTAVAGFSGGLEPALSADGRFVVFKTLAGAVVRFDTASPTGTVAAWFPPTSGLTYSNVSVFPANPRVIRPLRGGLAQGFGDSNLVVSANGRFAAFTIGTNTLTPGDTIQNVARVDFESFTPVASFCCEGSSAQFWITNLVPLLEIASTNFFPGLNTPPVRSLGPAMADDGSTILFLSDAINDPGMARDGRFRLYLRDMAATAPVTLSTNPVAHDSLPALNAIGRRAAWESTFDDPVLDDWNAASDVFVRTPPTGASVMLASARHPSRPAATGRARAAVTLGALNAGGTRLAFLSADPALAANDTNGLIDAFLFDRATGTNIALSATPFVVTNAPPRYLPSNGIHSVQLDAGGRRALFRGGYHGSTNNQAMLWRDLAGGTNLLVAVSASPPLTALSADGRFVFFQSADNASSLGSGFFSDNNNVSDVFLWNSALTINDYGRRLSAVSSDRLGTTGSAASINPVPSPDGCWLAFLSLATNLAPGATGATNFQLHARDQFCHPTNYLNGTNRLISYRTTASLAANGRSLDQPWPGGATNPVFTAGNRYLFFQDGLSNVIYRHDLLNPFVMKVTFVTNSIFATNIARVTNATVCVDCRNPSVSADGRFLAYEAVGGGTNIVVKDLASGTTQGVSLNFAGAAFGSGPSFSPLLTWDARYVVFTSKADDLVPGDNNRAADVFLRDMRAGVTFCLSANAAGNGTGNRVSSHPILSADGRTVAFQSFASDLAPGDYNDTRDVFVVSLAGPDTDGDGLEDDWEVAYFNDLARDGSGDFDGDGANDRAEFLAGTDPIHNGSVLRVLALVTRAYGPTQNPILRDTTIHWPTTPGRSYRVQFKPAISSPWTDLPGDVTAAGVTAQKLHTAIPGPAQGYYRVVLLAP